MAPIHFPHSSKPFCLCHTQNYFCLNNGNYTSNSTYSTNLNTLLSSLSSNMDNSGFYNASEGQNPDRANAIALCRGTFSSTSLLNLCPNQKQAILWREFCTLRYSNESIFGIRADGPVFMLRNVFNVSSPEQFNENLSTLVDDLRNLAASGGARMKVAAGSGTAPDFQTIFVLLQCTPDISGQDCTGCLIVAAQRIPRCCDNARGVRILAPSCNLRYEIEPFYNITRIQEAQAMLSVPVPVSAPVPGVRNGDDNRTRTVILIVVPIVVSLILAACVGICLRKRIKKKLVETTANDDEVSSAESLQYDFGKIRAATDDFSEANKLGQGGFGAVYKGKLQNGQEIAVKRLSKSSGQGDQEFKNEVLLVAKLKHRNLVRLLGFALENREASYSIKRSYIDCDRRYKIIGGIARGLLYLHEDSRFRIIHHDLKASNILLDGEMNPKIADFGMAKLFCVGYMAPEYAMHGQLSVKLDVFSFGVLVLEIVSGQKNNSFRNGENVEECLAWRNWREGSAINMIDPVLRSSSGSLRDILRCIHIGLLCVQENAVDRPTMASVVLMSNSFSITLPVPSQPAFFMSGRLDPDTSLLQRFNSRELESSKYSENKLDQSTHSSQTDAPIFKL
ncbi:hypothetical protein Pfo_028099 [Paulownia fortunei]|nr:hypothetical protein Pfo_028099 [Paulownia fortunei]